MDMPDKFRTVEEYCISFPPEIREKLEEMRTIILMTAPEAEEAISYNMPAIKLNGMVVYYAAWKEHIGFYPASYGALKEFDKEFAAFPRSKGTVRFKHDKPLPVDLISRVVAFRLKENEVSAAAKRTAKQTKASNK